MKAPAGDTLRAKAALRKALQSERDALDPERVRAESEWIAECVIALPEFTGAETILAYLAKPREVQMAQLLGAAWRAGKQVAVPASRLDGEYVPAWLNPGDPVKAMRFGVPEPVTAAWAKPDRFDLVIVPGVAFAASGARLGHGKGYYDRMLARLGRRAVCKVGVCFGLQLAPELPVEDYDVNMEIVVAGDQVYRSPAMTGGIERG